MIFTQRNNPVAAESLRATEVLPLAGLIRRGQEETQFSRGRCQGTVAGFNKAVDGLGSPWRRSQIADPLAVFPLSNPRVGRYPQTPVTAGAKPLQRFIWRLNRALQDPQVTGR